MSSFTDIKICQSLWRIWIIIPGGQERGRAEALGSENQQFYGSQVT